MTASDHKPSSKRYSLLFTRPAPYYPEQVDDDAVVKPTVTSH